MQFSKFRVQAYDTVAKSDLKNAMTALEAYFVDWDTYPATSSELLANDLNLSNDVCFTKYDVKTKEGVTSVHMHIRQSASPNVWHADYPKEGNMIEIRDAEPCI